MHKLKSLQILVLLVSALELGAAEEVNSDDYTQEVYKVLHGLLIDETPQYQGVLKFFQWTRVKVSGFRNAGYLDDSSFYPEIQRQGLAPSKVLMERQKQEVETKLLAPRGLPKEPISEMMASLESLVASFEETKPRSDTEAARLARQILSQQFPSGPSLGWDHALKDDLLLQEKRLSHRLSLEDVPTRLFRKEKQRALEVWAIAWKKKVEQINDVYFSELIKIFSNDFGVTISYRFGDGEIFALNAENLSQLEIKKEDLLLQHQFFLAFGRGKPSFKKVDMFGDTVRVTILRELDFWLEREIEDFRFGNLHQLHDSTYLALYLIIYLNKLLNGSEFFQKPVWSAQVLDQLRSNFFYYEEHAQLFDPAVNWDNGIIDIQKIYYWGLARRLDYWEKRDEIAKDLNKPHLDWDLFTLAKLEKLVSLSRRDLKADTAVSFSSSREKPSNTSLEEVDGQKKIKIFRISRAKRLPGFLAIADEEEVGLGLVPFAANNYSLARGMQIDALVPQLLGIEGLLPIPRPDGYELSALKLRTTEGKELSDKRDYELLITSDRQSYFAKLHSPKLNSRLVYSAKYRQTKGAATNQQAFPLLPRDRSHDLAKQLSSAGMWVLAKSVEEALKTKEQLSLRDLENIFQKNSKYSYLPAQYQDSEELSICQKFREFIDADGVLCGQCDSSNQLFAAVLKEIFRDHPEIKIRNRRGFLVGQSLVDLSQLHLQTELVYRGQVLVLDATPWEMDTRTYDELMDSRFAENSQFQTSGNESSHIPTGEIRLNVFADLDLAIKELRNLRLVRKNVQKMVNGDPVLVAWRLAGLIKKAWKKEVSESLLDQFVKIQGTSCERSLTQAELMNCINNVALQTRWRLQKIIKNSKPSLKSGGRFHHLNDPLVYAKTQALLEAVSSLAETRSDEEIPYCLHSFQNEAANF